MQVWNLLHAARWKHRTQKVAKNCHLGTIAQVRRAISSQLRNVSIIAKKLVKQQYVLHMFPQYGELRRTSGWDRLTSLGYPCKFQLLSRLGSVTARHLVVGVSQTLRRWTEGATYIRQGDHHVGHWPTFLVVSYNNGWTDRDAVWDDDIGQAVGPCIRWGPHYGSQMLCCTMHCQLGRKPLKLPLPRGRRTDPQPQATCAEKFVKIARVVPEISCGETDRQ